MTDIEVGKHVKYFLRNGMVLEGFVEKDTPSECILKSIDGKNLLIVHRPTEDILLTKVLLEEPEIVEEKVVETPKKLTETQQEVRDKLQQVIRPTGEPELVKLNIKQLRVLVQEQDKQIIAQKKKEHFGSPGAAKRAVPYSTPKSAYMPGKLPRT
jgi:hypothetical protein